MMCGLIWFAAHVDTSDRYLPIFLAATLCCSGIPCSGAGPGTTLTGLKHIFR
jgi:hypothetical protein